MIGQILASFLGTITISILFNIPKKELIYCGITGALGWFVYFQINALYQNAIAASFFAVLVVTFMARVLAFRRTVPFTVFAVAGLITIVPGAGIYNTMYMIIVNRASEAGQKGIETIKIAGAIALAMILVFSLPWNFFSLFGKKK